MRTELSDTFYRMRVVAGKTVQEVGELGRICPTYVRRIEDGEKENVGPEALRRIWHGIIYDREILKRAREAGELDLMQLARLAEAAAMTAADSKRTDD